MVLQELISSDPYFIARVKTLPEIKPELLSKDFDAIVGSLKDLSLKIIKINPNISPEASFAIKNIAVVIPDFECHDALTEVRFT